MSCPLLVNSLVVLAACATASWVEETAFLLSSLAVRVAAAPASLLDALTFCIVCVGVWVAVPTVSCPLLVNSLALIAAWRTEGWALDVLAVRTAVLVPSCPEVLIVSLAEAMVAFVSDVLSDVLVPEEAVGCVLFATCLPDVGTTWCDVLGFDVLAGCETAAAVCSFDAPAV